MSAAPATSTATSVRELARPTCRDVALHARAGEHLAARRTLGYLARELCKQIPALLDIIAGRRTGAATTIRPTPGGRAPGQPA